MHTARRGHLSRDRRLAIYQIPVNIVFEDEFRGIKPASHPLVATRKGLHVLLPFEL